MEHLQASHFVSVATDGRRPVPFEALLIAFLIAASYINAARIIF